MLIAGLHDYDLRRISVELDDYAQVLRIAGPSFSPEMVNAIAELRLLEDKAHMKAMGVLAKFAQESYSAAL